jgi:5-hydroxyisourate hydrolase-like protein (transthyretin family)
VTGHLLDAGKPVAGVQVAVVQLNRMAGGHFIKAVGATTDGAGRFVFENLPASQKYAIFSNVSSNSPTSPVLETRTFMVPADGGSRDLGTLPALPPMSLSGRITMPDGAKVPPEARVALGRDPAWDLIAASVAEDGSFSFAPLPPETYVINVVAKGFEADPSGLGYQTLGATSFGVRMEKSITNLTIPMKRSGPTLDRARVATKDPAAEADSNKVLAEYEQNLKKSESVTLVGRVLKDGKPRRGVAMSLYRSPSGSPGRYAPKPFAEVKTDDLGRYAVPGLAAGDGYYFRVHPGDTSADPGWSHQSPYLQTVRPGTAGFVRLPDIRLIDRDQSLSGIVVDPKGTPVSGVTVSAKIADTYIHLSRPEHGPPPWMETDAQGRFDLHQLPNLPIELMIYIRNPQGGPILHPAIARPKRNQSDIRILFDTTLTEKPEDLDMTAETRPSP